VTENLREIKGPQPSALLFLSISDNDAEKVLDVEPGSFVPLGQDHESITVRPRLKAQRARPIFGFDVPLPQVQWLHEMAICVNDTTHNASLLIWNRGGPTWPPTPRAPT